MRARRVCGTAVLLAAIALLASLPAGAKRTTTATPAAPNFTSFLLSASSFVYSYNSTLQSTAFASFHDYDCSPSYQCDRNVLVEFTLHRGFGTFAPIAGRQQGETGQYGSSVRATFRLPSCRLIPRFRSVTYTVEVVADAPNGDEKTTTNYVYLRSCR
jgi:hypothetical protein